MRETSMEKMPNKIKDFSPQAHTRTMHVKEQPLTHAGCGNDTPLAIKVILTEIPTLNNRIRQFFDSIKKTMKQLLKV